MAPTLPTLSSFLRQPPLASSPESAQQQLTGPFVPAMRPREPILQHPPRQSPPLYDTTTDSGNSSAEQCFSDANSARPSLQALPAPAPSSESHASRSHEPLRKRKSTGSNRPSAASSVVRRQASPTPPLSVAAVPRTTSLTDSSSSAGRMHKKPRSYNDSHSRVLSTSASAGHSHESSSRAPLQRERTSRYLSEGDRRDIIRRIDGGEKQVGLAKEYMVSRAAICNLYKNRREVLTRVDRDPDAKHPKRHRSKAFEEALTPLQTSLSPPPSAASVTAAPTLLPSLTSPGRPEPDSDDSFAHAAHSERVAPVGFHRSVDESRALEPKLEATTAALTSPQQQPRQRTRLSPSAFQRPLQPIAPLLASASRAPSPPPLRSFVPLQAHTQRAALLAPPHIRRLEQQHLHQPLQPFHVHDASAHSLPLKKLLRSLSNGQVAGFRHQADRMLRLLIEEALGCIPQCVADVITPRGDSVSGVATMDERDVCAVSIEPAAHSGRVLLRAFAAVQPLSPTGVITLTPTAAHGSRHIALQSPQRSDAWAIHAQLPQLHSGQVVLLFDLLCTTGERACRVLQYLVRDVRVVPSRIYFVTVNSALRGLQRVHQSFPDVVLVTAQMDTVVDDQRCIHPGIGNFLERYWHPHYERAHRAQYCEHHHEPLRTQYSLYGQQPQQQQQQHPPQLHARHAGPYQRSMNT